MISQNHLAMLVESVVSLYEVSLRQPQSRLFLDRDVESVKYLKAWYARALKNV